MQKKATCIWQTLGRDEGEGSPHSLNLHAGTSFQGYNRVMLQRRTHQTLSQPGDQGQHTQC